MRKSCILLPFSVLLFACSSSPTSGERTGEQPSTLSGSGSAANGAPSQLAKYHWAAWGGGSGRSAPGAYLAGVLDTARTSPVVHSGVSICRQHGGAGLPGVLFSTQADCYVFGPNGLSGLRVFDVLADDDPNAFTWVEYSGSLPSNAIAATAGGAPFCRVWEEGADGTDAPRGIDVGTVVNGACRTAYATTAAEFQVLTTRAPAATCSDAITSWPAGGDPNQETCDGESLYTPACYASAAVPVCGISGYQQLPVYRTCASSAFGLDHWAPPTTTTVQIHNNCALVPCNGLYLDGECSDWAAQRECSLAGTQWCNGDPHTSGHLISVDYNSMQLTCSVTYSTPVWKTKQDPACGVDHTVNDPNAPIYNACRASVNDKDSIAGCGSTPTHAPRGLTAKMEQQLWGGLKMAGKFPFRWVVYSYPNVQCTTCENLAIDTTSPASTQSTAAAKFSCLYGNYLAVEGGDEDGAQSAASIAREMKLLFELHGDALTDPAQRAFALSLYAPPLQTASTSLARCAADTAFPVVPGTNSPTLVAQAPRTLDVLYEASNTEVRVRELAPGAAAWGAEANLSGATLSRPGAVAWGFTTGERRLDVFSPGTDRTLYHNWYTPSLGGHWEGLGGAMAGGAGVTSWASGRLDIFYIGPDHALKHRSHDVGSNPNFSAEENLGGNYVGDVSAASWGVNRIDVVMKSATDGSLMHVWWDNGWAGPETLAGPMGSNPSIASWGPGRLDMFWAAPDQSLHHRAFDQVWQAEENLGVVIKGDPAAASAEPNRVDVAAEDPVTGQIVVRSFMNAAPGTATPLGCTWLDASADLLCGTTDTAPVTVAPSCRAAAGAKGAQYDQDLTELAACQALSLSHVPPAAVATEVDRCEGAIGRLLAQPEATCNGGASATLAFNLAQAALNAPLAGGAALQGDLQARLAHIQAFWTALPPSARVATQASQLVGLIYKPLYALQTTSAQGTPQAASLQQLAGTATSLLNAAFTPYAAGPTPTAAPLTTAPLGLVVSNALQPLVDRLAELGVFQDVACRYAPGGCPAGTTTPLTQMWSELAALGSATGFHTAVGAAGLVTDPWKTAFGNLDTMHASLDLATTDAAGGTWDPAAANPPATLAQLAKIVAAAQLRMTSFAAIGQLELGPPNTIHTGLQDAKVTSLISQFSNAVGTLLASTQSYGSASNTLLQNLLTDLRTQAETTSLVDKLNGLSQQFQNETASLQALRASAAAEDLRFADFMKAFQGAVSKPAFDPNAKVQVGASKSISVSAADARWSSTASVNLKDVAVAGWSIPTADAPVGSSINFQISGRWSPTCALSRSAMPDGKKPATTGVYTGPEGFALSYSNGAYAASSQQTNESDTSGYSNTENNCQSFNWNLGLGWSYIVNIGAGGSGSDQSCFNTTQGHSTTTSNIAGNTTEQRTTASFAAGMRLDDTPFPNAPAGALLLVEVKPGSQGARGEVGDVRVLTEPNATVLVSKAVDYYLVVNDDTGCTGFDGSPLTVQSAVLQPFADKAKQMGAAMATAYGAIRGEVDLLAKQGVIQADEGALLRAQAYNDVRSACTAAGGTGPSCEPSAYPPALLGVFDTWLDKEIVRMERQADILNVERQRQLTILDMKGVTDDLVANGAQAAITAQLPDWEMFNLDAAVLGADSRTFASLAALYLYPIAEIRYPDALTNLAADSTAQSALRAMQQVGWDSSIQTVGATAVIFGKELASVFQTEVNNGQNANQRVQWAVLSVPNPNAPPPPIGSMPTPSTWQQVDAARAQEIWSAIAAGNSITLTLNPDDLYNVHGGSSILTCSEAVPVISAMGAYVATVDSAFNALNQTNFGVPMGVSDRLQFSTATGTQSFRFDTAKWLGQPVRTYFGVSSLAMSTVQTDLVNAQAQAGLSPFAQFTLDITKIKSMSPSPLDGATELDLVFQLDVAAVSPGLGYLPACRAP